MDAATETEVKVKDEAQEKIVGLTISDESWSSPLTKSMYEMAKNGQLCDTEIITPNDDVYFAHSTVLASRSEILKQTFFASACSKYKVKAKEISSDTWKSLLEFMYLGTVDLEPCQLKELSTASDILEMDTLKANCQSALQIHKEMGNLNEMEGKTDQSTHIEPEMMKYAAGISETLEFVSAIEGDENAFVEGDNVQEDNRDVYYMVQDNSGNDKYVVQSGDSVTVSSSASYDTDVPALGVEVVSEAVLPSHITGASPTQTKTSTVPAGTLPGGRRGRPKTKDPEKSSDFKCSICEKVYSTKQSLERHVHLHTNLTPFTCELCGKSFKTGRYLIAHIERHNEKRTFQCPICGKSFKTARDANWHKKTVHSAVRSFQCKYCAFSTKTRALLNQHMFSHTSTKEWVCKTCGKAFLRKQHLEQHASRHEGKRQYMCSTCGGEFYTIYACKEHHMRVHQGIKRYECSVCHQQYNEKKSFMKHLQKHSVDLVLKLDGGDIIIEHTVEEAIS